MGTLWLYAISLDDVREFFAAPADEAAELLDLARQVAREPAKTSLLSKVGPAFKRPIATPFVLVGPTMDDAKTLVEGRSTPPDRLGPAWAIVRQWCAAKCRDNAQVNVERSQLATVDFANVTSGLSSQFSFTTMLARDPHLPLLPAPGLVVGWIPNNYVQKMSENWAQVIAAAGWKAGNESSGGTTFSRDDQTGVGFSWPLDGSQPADWWDAINGFFERAVDWAVSDHSPDVLALYQ